MDIDFVDLQTRILHRQREDLRQRNQVLEAELDASISCFHVTNKEYHRYEDLSKVLQAENEARDKELMELEAQLDALEKEKEKLQADLKMTQSSLDDIQMQNALL